MLRFARISKLAIRHIASCNAVRQGDTLRLAHLHMSCFSPVPAHHPVLLSMAFPIHAASHPLVSTSLNSSAYSYAFHASCLRSALLLFLSSNLFPCAAVFPIFALFCQALDLPFIFLFARPVANGAVYPTPAFFSQHIFISYTHSYPSEQRLPSASPLSKHSERKVVAFPHLLSFILHAAAPHSHVLVSSFPVHPEKCSGTRPTSLHKLQHQKSLLPHCHTFLLHLWPWDCSCAIRRGCSELLCPRRVGFGSAKMRWRVERRRCADWMVEDVGRRNARDDRGEYVERATKWLLFGVS